MNDSRGNTTNPIKINHNLASMLDVTPSYPVVQLDKHCKKKSKKREMFVTTLLVVSTVLFETLLVLQLEHIIGTDKVFRILMYCLGILSILTMLYMFVTELKKTKKKKEELGEHHG